MDKLFVFLREHNTSPAIIVRDLKHAADQLPKSSLIDEGTKLQEAALKAQRSRRKGPQELGTLLVAVLARLGCRHAPSLCLLERFSFSDRLNGSLRSDGG